MSGSTGGPALTPVQETTLHRLAEVLTPGGGGFPTAADADPDGSVLEMALSHAKREARTAKAVLNEAVGQPPEAYLEALARRDPDRFDALQTFLVARYLSCRPVWTALGFTGHRPTPPQPGEAEHHLRGGILDPVIGRGKIYIPTPPDAPTGMEEATHASARPQALERP